LFIIEVFYNLLNGKKVYLPRYPIAIRAFLRSPVQLVIWLRDKHIKLAVNCKK